MQSDETQGDAAASRVISGACRLSRRQAIGRMSVLATAGAAVWVAPEILTAKPAGGATLSAPAVMTLPATVGGTLGGPDGVVSSPATSSSSLISTLASTGLDIQRDAEVGAALVAGGWAMHHWASRTPTSTPTPTPEAKSPGAPA